jgi:hypothetical protein
VLLISSSYGIDIFMYYEDNLRHHGPHIHAKYGGLTAVFTINEGKNIHSKFPTSKRKLVQAWIEIHKPELMNRLAIGA